MPERSIEELRAIVGDDGRDLSDDELLRMNAAYLTIRMSIIGVCRDTQDPVGAANRATARRLENDLRLRARRARYSRERTARRERRSA